MAGKMNGFAPSAFNSAITCLAQSPILAMPRLPQPTAIVMPGLILARTSERSNCSATVCATLSTLTVLNFWRMWTMRGNGMSRPPAMLTSMRSPIISCPPSGASLLFYSVRRGGDQGFVQREVALRAGVPAEVARHPVLLQLAPDLLVVVRLHGALHGHREAVAAHRLEQEAGGGLVCKGDGLAVDYGIVQTSCVVHHRRGAVALTVHLVQAARLEARGHQEDVRPRLDLMGQAFVVTHLNRDPSRIGARQR